MIGCFIGSIIVSLRSMRNILLKNGLVSYWYDWKQEGHCACHPLCEDHFEGHEMKLHGFVYDCLNYKNSNQYIETTKEIVNYGR